MAVASLVNGFVEEVRVPMDSNDPFLGRYDVEKIVRRLEVPECAFRQENGYSREQRVAHERVLARSLV